MTPTLAIETRSLARSYKTKRTRGDQKDVVAFHDVNLAVERGELFGLLGPNGAGKSSLIKVLVTLLLPSNGTARVAGFDVEREARAIRSRIGVVSGGEQSGYGLLTVREQLWMFSQFHGLPSKAACARIEELLEVVGLAHAGDRRVSALSTGMRQKMNLVRALVPDPEILFLDEPTLGLDVTACRDVRAYIRTWMKEKPGRTILLTTHYLHEAEELCDRVAIIDKGTIVACDSPSGLSRAAAGSGWFVVRTDPIADIGWLRSARGVESAEAFTIDGRMELHLRLAHEAAIGGIMSALATRNHTIYSLEKVEPTLEEVFFQIVEGAIEPATEDALAYPS